MSQTTPLEFIANFGGTATTTDNSVLSRGATVRRLTGPNEGFSTTEPMELINGHDPVHNGSTQTITLPSVEVDENSAAPFVIAIRPTRLTDSLKVLYREVADGNPTLETMNYENDPNDDGSEADSLNVDVSSYLFSQTTLGSSKSLRITGNVLVKQTGSYIVKQTASGTAVSGKPTTYGASATGGTATAMTTDTDGSVYGYWPVLTTFQSGVDFDSFILKAGSAVPGDDVFQTVDGKEVKFSLMPGIADGSNNFINDFTVSSSQLKIVKSFSTKDVCFPYSVRIPEGTIVGFDTFVAGSTAFSALATDNTTDGKYVEYAYGASPQYTMSFYQGSKIDVPVTLRDGYSAPAGMIAGTGTTFDDKDGSVITTNVILSNLRLLARTMLPSGVSLAGVVLNGDRAKIPKGESSAQLQSILLGSKTEDSLTLSGVVFPADSSLGSSMIFTVDTELPSDVTVDVGTTLKAKTVIVKGAKTLAGATIEGELVIDTGSVANDVFDVSTEFVVEPSASSSQTLKAGATLKGPFKFTPTTQITDGNILPAAFKVLMTMGTVLSAGMELAAATVFGAGAYLYGNLGFDPKGVIPAQSVLYGNITIPTGATLPKDTVLNVALPVPTGTKFHTGDTMYAGTTIHEASPLPALQDLGAQAGAAYSGSGPAAGPLTKFVDSSGVLWLVVKARTTFMAGFVFPLNSILSKVTLAGETNSTGTGTYGANGSGSSTDYTWNAGEYSTDTRDRSPAAQDFTFTAGTPTDQIVVALTDINFDSDMLLPLSDLDASAGSLLALQEPFTLQSDLVLTEDYTVRGNKAVMWPANIPIPTTFVFSAPYSFTTPGAGTPLNKDLTFNTRTTERFITGVLDSTSHIKLPLKGYKTLSHIRLAVDQPVATNGTNAFRSTVELAPGTKLETSAGHITLQQDMNVSGDFILGADMTVFPRIFLPHGIRLLAGQATPGQIHVRAGQGLPKNLTLSQSVVLAADHVVAETTYTLPKYSVVAAGTSFARGTTFTSGFVTEQKVIIAPFLSLGDDNIFYVPEGNEFTTDVYYPYIVDSNGIMPFFRVDGRALIQKLVALTQVVEALQSLAH